LLRAAAVVRHWRHVRDGSDADAQGAQSAHRRFATRTGALDFDVDVLDALFNRGTTSNFGSHLSCERRRLARAHEAYATRRSPRQCIAMAVSDGDDRVVERRMHVSDTVRNVLANLLANALRCVVCGRFSHSDLSISLF